MEPTISEKCPKCGKEMISEGINNGIGYVYPPFHCQCGWSEMCGYKSKENCKRCDQYKNCFNGGIEDERI